MTQADKLVNIEYIAFISNNNDIAEYNEIEIEDHSSIIREIEAYAVGNDSVENIYRKWCELCPFEFWWQGYCLDNEYNDAGYTVIMGPNHIVKNYRRELVKLYAETNSEYAAKRKRLHNNYEISKIEKERKDELDSIRNKLSIEYKGILLRVIRNAKRVINYQFTVDKLLQRSNIVAYSSDQKGWSNFRFLQINDDIGIHIKTNFCYGASSYFIVSIIYKGIEILPYSYLVKYYYARSIDIIRGTREFARSRSSWKPALEFAVSCANKAKQYPQEFIRRYILKEVRTLINQLEFLIQNPEQQIIRLKNSPGDKTIELNHIDRTNLDSMLILDTEFATAYTAMKVTDSLDFINSLKKLSSDFLFIRPYMNRIISINQSILEQVKRLKSNVDESLVKYESEYKLLNTKLKQITSDKIECKLADSEDILENDMQTLRSNINKRKRFVDELESYIEVIENTFNP